MPTQGIGQFGFLISQWKGFCYGKKTRHNDKITCCFGKNCIPFDTFLALLSKNWQKISTLHCKVALFLTFKNTPEKYNRDLRLVIRELLQRTVTGAGCSGKSKQQWLCHAIGKIQCKNQKFFITQPPPLCRSYAAASVQRTAHRVTVYKYMRIYLYSALRVTVFQAGDLRYPPARAQV